MYDLTDIRYFVNYGQKVIRNRRNFIIREDRENDFKIFFIPEWVREYLEMEKGYRCPRCGRKYNEMFNYYHTKHGFCKSCVKHDNIINNSINKYNISIVKKDPRDYILFPTLREKVLSNSME